MYELSIRKEAELDIDSQFRYYERVRVGLGHDYLLCVEEAIVKIQRHPLIYKKIYKNLRRLSVRRYPHMVYFFIKDRTIVVTAVFHVRKNPSYWDDRT
jgi:toxin ParE1/3/4